MGASLMVSISVFALVVGLGVLVSRLQNGRSGPAVPRPGAASRAGLGRDEPRRSRSVEATDAATRPLVRPEREAA